MGHSSELLEKIQRDLRKKYSLEDYSYILEKKLLKNRSRIYPDIQIIQGEKIVCVVEIGYTRPEKLKIYRGLKIPDIRWYSKDGLLINEELPKIIIEKFIPDENDLWIGLPLSESEISYICETCYEDFTTKDSEDLEESEKAEDEDEVLDDERIEESMSDWSGYIFTNGIRRFFLGEHDICGSVEIYRGSFIFDDLHLFRPYKDRLEPLETYDDFWCYKNRLERELREIIKLSTEELIKFLNGYGIAFEYENYLKWEKLKING